MPFNSIPTINANPNVRIFFEGLLMLRPVAEGSINRCDVHAINHSSHNMFVEVSIDEPQPTYPFLRLGHNDLHSDGLEISTGTPTDVKKLTVSNPTASTHSFDESVDFAKLHPGSSFESGGAHHGVIKIKNGILYTAKRQPIASLRRGSECHDRSVATVLAANIDISSSQNLKLTWKSGSLELPHGDDPMETKYIILIGNLCRVPPDPAESDFKHLYHCVRGVSENDKYELVFKGCHDRTTTTTRVPCIPGNSGG